MSKENKVIIDTTRCKGCRFCVLYCPKKSLSVSKELNNLGVYPVVVTDDDSCNSCGFCYLVCPEVCIEVYK